MGKYYLFIDESGSHNFSPSENYPVFVVCGLIFSHENYMTAIGRIKELKRAYLSSEDIILHSNEIRKRKSAFSFIGEDDKYILFLDSVSKLIEDLDFTIISCSIDKRPFYELSTSFSNIYEQGITYMLERTVFWMNSYSSSKATLDICIEKRGNKEDRILKTHIEQIITNGTQFLQPHRFAEYRFDVHFRAKIDKVEGLQLADLCAYPIAKDELGCSYEPYKVVEKKFYKSKDGKLIFGRKKF